MSTYPRKFWLYMLPFLAVIPLTLLFLIVAESVIESRNHTLLEKLTEAEWENINTDLDYLMVQGNEIAAEPALQEHILANDYESILATMLAERQARNIGLMGLADKDGFIITRTKTVALLGDNVFTGRPQGRALAHGAPSVRTIESGADPFADQVIMTTARWVVHDDEKIGALFTNYLLDDDYARKSVNNYLSAVSPRAQVTYYNTSQGIYGSSFTDISMKDAVDGYFTPEHLPGPDQVIRVTLDGQDYLVKNLAFKGLESTETGALLFQPTPCPARVVIYAFLSALFLALLADFLLRKKL